MNQIGDRLQKAKNKIVFFELKLGKINTKVQKILLSDKRFLKYKYFLVRLFKEARYRLSEKEESLNNLLSSTSYSSWVDGNSKLVSKQTVKHKGKDIPLSEASVILPNLKRKDRINLYKKIVDKNKSISHFAESEINAIYNYKKIMDELRGYKKPYSETILEFENEEKNIEQLVDLVSSNFHISKRFYKLHSKLLKEKTLGIYDINSKIGKINKKFPFEKSLEIVGDIFEKFDPICKKMLFDFAENGQMDVNPKKGKRGGAYCWGKGMEPTFLMLNHKDDLYSLETLAHEMGHGIHTELAKGQSSFYIKYSTSTAEVASTFFEQMALDEIEKILSPKEKIVLLHNKIKGDIATIFRQIACFNFENELHQKIRKEGFLEDKEIAKLMSKHLKSYLGDSVNVTNDDGYIFVRWSHIRSYFYVYSYAYGQIISKAMLYKWKEDKTFSKKIIEFLRAGRSDSPENIFKKIGIDTTKLEFFKQGLKSIEADIDRLEKLIK
jgi:oligoendopeptidase F